MRSSEPVIHSHPVDAPQLSHHPSVKPHELLSATELTFFNPVCFSVSQAPLSARNSWMVAFGAIPFAAGLLPAAIIVPAVWVTCSLLSRFVQSLSLVPQVKSTVARPPNSGCVTSIGANSKLLTTMPLPVRP